MFISDSFISACCILEGPLIFVQFGGILGTHQKFLMNHLFIFPIVSATSKLSQESPEHITSHAFREISISTRRSSLCPGGCDTQKEARALFIRLWNILKTSAPVLTQDQDHQNKVNFKISTIFDELEKLPTDHRLLDSSHYILRQLCAKYSNKVRLAEVTSAQSGDLHWLQRMIQKHDKRIRRQDLLFIEKLDHAESPWSKNKRVSELDI